MRWGHAGQRGAVLAGVDPVFRFRQEAPQRQSLVAQCGCVAFALEESCGTVLDGSRGTADGQRAGADGREGGGEASSGRETVYQHLRLDLVHGEAAEGQAPLCGQVDDGGHALPAAGGGGCEGVGGDKGIGVGFAADVAHGYPDVGARSAQAHTQLQVAAMREHGQHGDAAVGRRGVAFQLHAVVAAGGDGGGAVVGAADGPSRGHAFRWRLLELFAVGRGRRGAETQPGAEADGGVAAYRREVYVVVLARRDGGQCERRRRGGVVLAAAAEEALRAVLYLHGRGTVQALPRYRALFVHRGFADAARGHREVVDKIIAGCRPFDFQGYVIPRSGIIAQVEPQPLPFARTGQRHAVHGHEGPYRIRRTHGSHGDGAGPEAGLVGGIGVKADGEGGDAVHGRQHHQGAVADDEAMVAGVVVAVADAGRSHEAPPGMGEVSGEVFFEADAVGGGDDALPCVDGGGGGLVGGRFPRRAVAGIVGASRPSAFADGSEGEGVRGVGCQPLDDGWRDRKGVAQRKAWACHLDVQTSHPVALPGDGGFGAVQCCYPHLFRHAGLQADVVDEDLGLVGTSSHQHQGHPLACRAEVHDVVLPRLAAGEEDGVARHKRAYVGNVVQVPHQQHGSFGTQGGVGPESHREVLALGGEVGQQGHRMAVGCGGEEQRPARRVVALGADDGIFAHLRPSAPREGQVVQRVEVLAVGQCHRSRCGLQVHRLVEASVAVARGAQVQRIVGAGGQPREVHAVEPRQAQACAGGIFACGRGDGAVFQFHAVAAHGLPGDVGRCLAYGAHFHRRYGIVVHRQRVEVPGRGAAQGYHLAFGNGQRRQVVPPAAASFEGVGRLEGAVGVDHEAHLQHAAAVAVALQQQGVGDGDAGQRHQCVRSEVQAVESFVRVVAYGCRPLSADPSLRQTASLFEVHTVGCRHLVGEGCNAVAVVGAGGVAARGRHHQVIFCRGAQPSEGEGIGGGGHRRAASRRESAGAVFYADCRTGGRGQGVPCHGHRPVGEVVEAHVVYQTPRHPHVVHPHRAFAHSHQGYVASRAAVALQAHRLQLPLSVAVEAVHRCEAPGLEAIVHHPHQQARARGAVHAQGEGQRVDRHPVGRQRQHRHAALSARGVQRQAALLHGGLQGCRHEPSRGQEAGAEGFVPCRRQAGGRQGGDADLLHRLAGASHAEGVCRQRLQACEGQRRHGVGHKDAVVFQPYGSGAVALPVHDEAVVCHVVDRGCRGAAAFEVQVVDVAGTGFGLQRPLQAEGHAASRAAVGAEVHQHLLPASALGGVHRVQGHEVARVAPRVVADAHLQGHSRRGGIVLEACIVAFRERGVGLGAYGHAVVAAREGAAVEHQRGRAAMALCGVEVGTGTEVVVVRGRPAGGHRRGAAAVGVEVLAPGQRHGATPRLGCSHAGHPRQKNRYYKTQYAHYKTGNAHIAKILCTR